MGTVLLTFANLCWGHGFNYLILSLKIVDGVSETLSDNPGFNFKESCALNPDLDM